METHDNLTTLLEAFRGVIEVRKPNPDLTLQVPTSDLAAGLEQATTLLTHVLHPDPADIDPQAVGRQRFPDIYGVLSLMADGLAQAPEIAEEIQATPAAFTGAVTLDQAIGRLVYAGQIVDQGGQLGEALAGAAAQDLCLTTVRQVRQQVQDLKQPADRRSSLAMIFEEAFRFYDDYLQQQQQAQNTSANAKQPYLDQAQQGQSNADLIKVVDAFVNEAQHKGGKIL